jgi:hypothetical protein
MTRASKNRAEDPETSSWIQLLGWEYAERSAPSVRGEQVGCRRGGRHSVVCAY